MRTKRLILRPLALEDAPRIAALAGDWEIARMTARIPYPYSVPQARQWIASLEPDEFVRGVLLGGELVGAVGYVAGKDGSAEIGYWIGRPWWGRGFATEAATALVRHCFTAERFQRLTCCHFTDNAGSARVIRKLGFKCTGSGEVWCEARRAAVETRIYARSRPVMARFWRRAA